MVAWGSYFDYHRFENFWNHLKSVVTRLNLFEIIFSLGKELEPDPFIS